MSSETLNLIFVIAAMAVGCFSVLLEVLYLFEAGRGVNELSFKEYKRYINVTFLVSNLILAFLWLTTHQMDGLVPILFVVQMGDVEYFHPNDATDPAFGQALRLAANAGVQVLAMDCAVTEDSMTIQKPVMVVL